MTTITLPVEVVRALVDLANSVDDVSDVERAARQCARDHLNAAAMAASVIELTS